MRLPAVKSRTQQVYKAIDPTNLRIMYASIIIFVIII
jgi:hypothetical protein